MSNTKYTPGPWTIPERDSGVTVNADGSIVAEVYAVDTGSTQVANAKLIAAAPEMVDALREAEAFMVQINPESRRLAIVRAALAKAGL